MADDKNIKTFTAEDIERYHKGQLSPKDMHAMEKAALDDAFLADALDGYTTTGVDVNKDIDDLRKRLMQKTEPTRIIPISKASRPFPWLRIAVILTILAGGGILFYQLLPGNKANSPVAENSTRQAKTESPDIAAKDPGTRSDKTTVTVSSDDSTALSGTSFKTRGRKGTVQYDTIQNGKAQGDSMQITAGAGALSKTNNPLPTVTEYKKDEAVGNVNNKPVAPSPKDEVASVNTDKNKESLTKKQAAAPAINNNNEAFYDAEHVGAPVANGVVKSKRAENNYRPNVFRGSVRDANNNAMPFVNITNTKDNVGTFSDAQGYFTLISSDSVLTVQLKSIGFENNNAQLRNSMLDNRVVMQEDRSISANVLDTVKRNWSRLRKSNVTVEEPEPEDGWDSYSTYVANNINVPDKGEMGRAGDLPDNTVEISFEVNKYGEPVNLKVEKSLCDKCDEEAKRLIKDGPKWKRKTNKSKRTTVTIPFVKP